MEYACNILLILSIFLGVLILKCESWRAGKKKTTSHAQAFTRMGGNFINGFDDPPGFFDYSITDIWWPTLPKSKTVRRSRVMLNYTVPPGFRLTRRSTVVVSTSEAQQAGSGPPQLQSPKPGQQDYGKPGYEHPGLGPSGPGPGPRPPNRFDPQRPGGPAFQRPPEYGPPGYENEDPRPPDFRPPGSDPGLGPPGFGPQRHRPPDYGSPEYSLDEIRPPGLRPSGLDKKSGPQRYEPPDYGPLRFPNDGPAPPSYRPPAFEETRPQPYRLPDYVPPGYSLDGPRSPGFRPPGLDQRSGPQQYRLPDNVPPGYSLDGPRPPGFRPPGLDQESGPQRYGPPDYGPPEFQGDGPPPGFRPPRYGQSAVQRYRPPNYGQPGPPLKDYGPPGFNRQGPKPQGYRPQGYRPPGYRPQGYRPQGIGPGPGFRPPVLNPSKFGRPYEAPPLGYEPMPADWQREGPPGHNTTTSTTTTSTTTTVAYGRPSFTPFHPMDFMRNVTSTQKTTTTPYSLLIEGQPPVEESTAQPFREDLESFMMTHKTGYFSTFATKLFELLSKKSPYEVKTLSIEFFNDLETVIEQSRLNFLGDSLLDTVYNFKNIMMGQPADVIKSKATVLHSLLLNRKVLVSTDVGVVIATFDTFFNTKQGEALFDALDAVNQYPVADAPAREVATNLLSALIDPMVKAGHTELGEVRRKKLLDTISKLIEQHSHDLAGLTVPESGRRRLHVTLAPQKVIKTINKILDKSYKGLTHDAKQRKYRHSPLKGLKKTHSQHAKNKRRQEHIEYKELRKARNGHKYQYIEKQGHKQNKAPKIEHKHKTYKKKRHKYRKIVSKTIDNQINSGNRHFTKLNNRNALHKAYIQKRFNVVTSNNLESDNTFVKRANDVPFVLSRKGGVQHPNSTHFNQSLANNKTPNRMLQKILASSSVSDEEQDLKANLYDAFYHGNKSLINARKSGWNELDASSRTDDEALLKNYIHRYFGYDPDVGLKNLISN